MDPNKLSALVEEQSMNPLGDLPMPEGEEEMDAEGEEETDMLARGEELLTSMGEFGEELREAADIIVDNAMEIGDDLSSEEPSPETEEAVEEAFDRMPAFVQDGMAENLADKERADLDAIGCALACEVETEESPEGEYTDMEGQKIGGLLAMASALAAMDSEGEEDEEEGDEEEEDLDDEGDEPVEEGDY